MNPCLLSLALLGAFAGGAMAQSPVTLYGRVDLSVGKPAGSSNKYLANGSGSRLGVRGVEDLGGGLQALFHIEHRFEADTGTIGTRFSSDGTPGSPISNQANTRFWSARSIVGLQGGFGQVVLGREYTPAYLQVQLPTDPWGLSYVVNNNGLSQVIGLGLNNSRVDSSLTYKITRGGFTVGAQVAEATDAFVNVPNKPWSAAVSYVAGPLSAGVSFERNGTEVTEQAQLINAMLFWDFGRFKLGGGFARGTTSTDLDRTGWMLAATAPVGGGEARLAVARRTDDLATGGDDTTHSIVAAGYHYNLSKRTTLYADVIHNREAPTSKTGYDVGIMHNF